MPGKIPQPWFRKSKGAWYVCIEGQQQRLGKERDAAFRHFYQLMAGEKTRPTPSQEQTEKKAEEEKPSLSLTVEQLIERYLVDGQRHLAKNTYRVVRDFTRSFAQRWGSLRADDIRKHHVEDWIAKHPTWGPMTEWDGKTKIVTLFNWAVEQELLSANMIRRIRKPAIRSRGKEALITEEDHARLLHGATPHLRNVLIALHQSGARPGEVISVSATEFYPDQGIWVLSKHKTAHKGHHRIIYLSPELTALCRDLAQRYPKGPLFRTVTGKPWCHTCYLAEQMRHLCKRLGIRGVILYGYRHSFATDALVNGVPDAQVAELLGHNGTAMLHRHYAHLTARTKALRDALGRVRPATN